MICEACGLNSGFLHSITFEGERWHVCGPCARAMEPEPSRYDMNEHDWLNAPRKEDGK